MLGKIAREDLLDELKRLQEEVDRAPRQSDMTDEGAYSTRPYEREFEAWADALRAADITPGPRQRQNQHIDEDDLLAELHHVAPYLGRAPSSREMDWLSEFSTTPYTTRWGSWNEVLEEAGLEPEFESVEDR
jgi:hypothetical protein